MLCVEGDCALWLLARKMAVVCMVQGMKKVHALYGCWRWYQGESVGCGLVCVKSKKMKECDVMKFMLNGEFL